MVSLLGIILGLPLMGVLALAIWLETGFPILFRQERVGLGQRPFTILKFRSMFQDAEAGGPSWALKNDPRATRIGRLLRKYRLDELPQLFNVLLGDMSLVVRARNKSKYARCWRKRFRCSGADTV